MLEFTKAGIYCPRGDFYIDPWLPVPQAIITHAHSDHARWGHHHYLSHKHSENILKQRLGQTIRVTSVEYGEVLQRNGVKISLHPAGHIYGSAQIRVEYRGEVWVVSGDYKLENDGISAPFEPVKCHTFITESTFGLPVFRWKPQEEIYADINAWWRANQAEGKASVIGSYALGKAQRLLSALDMSIGKVFVHGAIWNANEALRQSGAKIPVVQKVSSMVLKRDYEGSMIIATPSALNSIWMRKFQPYVTALASGWMNLRGTKRRRAVDKGFVLSDHADWTGLNEAVDATGAERVIVTHGYKEVFSRYLRETKGLRSEVVETLFEGEAVEPAETGDLEVAEGENE